MDGKVEVEGGERMDGWMVEGPECGSRDSPWDRSLYLTTSSNCFLMVMGSGFGQKVLIWDPPICPPQDDFTRRPQNLK